jgi:hypothetical protein
MGIGVMVTAKLYFLVNKGFLGDHERLMLDKASEKTVENNYDLPTRRIVPISGPET